MRVSLHRDRLVRVVRAEVLVHLNKLGNCQNLAIILLIINLIRLKPILHSRVMTFCFSEKNQLPPQHQHHPQDPSLKENLVNLNHA